MIGLLFIFVGICMRLLAIRTLGNCFSFLLLPQQKIVTKGVYKYIRHPSYTGSLLIILGMSLFHSVLGIMTIAYFFFMARTVNEELVLSQNNDYIEYIKVTGRFIPKLRR